jgi:hypothetical protein
VGYAPTIDKKVVGDNFVRFSCAASTLRPIHRTALPTHDEDWGSELHSLTQMEQIHQRCSDNNSNNKKPYKRRGILRINNIKCLKENSTRCLFFEWNSDLMRHRSSMINRISP